VLGHPLTIFCLVIAVFFYKELLFGLVFSPADQLLDANPWRAFRPPTYQTASNPLRSDDTLINLPHRVAIADDVKRYGITLWQDHTRAGSQESFSLHYLAGWIYLPMLAFLVMAAGAANTVLHITIPLYAGLTMYLLSSMLSQNRWARAFGAIAFALNGYSTVWLSSFVLPVIVATLPLGIYLGLRFLRDRRLLHGILFSVVSGAILYFAYPPAVIIFAVVTAIFVLCYWLASPRALTLPLLQLAGFGALGLGLGLAALLPTISDLRNVAASAYRGPESPIPIGFVRAFIFPNFAGNPIANDWRSAFGNYCEFIAYNGSLPFMLAGGGGLLALQKRRAAPLALAAVITGIVSFLLAYAGPVVRVVDSLPILNDLQPARWTIGIDFALAVLSIVALDALTAKGPRRLVVVGVAAGIGLFVAAALALLLVRHGELLHIDSFIAGDSRLRLALIILGAAALFCLALIRRASTLAAAFVVGILAVDLVSFGVDFNPAIPSAEFYPVTPAIAYLQQHAGPYRVLGVGGLYYTDDLIVYGLDVITGYDHFRDGGYITLLGDNLSDAERSLWSRAGFVTVSQQPHLGDAVFNLLAVKYAYLPAAPSDQDLSAWQHWRPVYSGPDGTVLENLEVLPKQFLVDTATNSPTAIDHVPVRPDRDRLQVDGAGLLVWSKPWSADWKVTVDGRPATTSTYAGYFLAVTLPPGHHVVSTSYEPRVYLLGALGSLLAALILIVIGVGRRLRPSRAPLLPVAA
jgi:hypothetical protein